jgi:hypothetical protein
MLTFIRRRIVQSGYGTAVVDIVFDDERDEWLHIIREVEASNGGRFENLNRVVVTASDPGEAIVDEALKAALQGVVTS